MCVLYLQSEQSGVQDSECDDCVILDLVRREEIPLDELIIWAHLDLRRVFNAATVVDLVKIYHLFAGGPFAKPC